MTQARSGAADRGGDFSRIAFDPTPNDRTPILPPATTGIAINAPERVMCGRRELCLPVAGFCRFSRGVVPGLKRVSDALAVVAVDQRRHRPHLGHCDPWGEEMPDPGPPCAEVLVGEYFNLDLARAARLPLVEAEYLIYAVFGAWRSNTLVVSVGRWEE